MRLERIDSSRRYAGNSTFETRGPELHHPSGNMGQGVYSRSELKEITSVGIGKPIFLQMYYHIRFI